MSCNPLNFVISRATASALTLANTPTMHKFSSSTDSIGTIIADGYFDPILPPPNSPISNQSFFNYTVAVGDLVMAQDNTRDTTLLQITQVSPTITTEIFVSPNIFQTTTLSGNFTGPFAPTAATLTLNRIYNTVFITIPRVFSTFTGSSFMGFSTELPAAYTPSMDINCPVQVTNAGNTDLGYVLVGSNSILNVGATNTYTAFSGSGLVGINASTIVYNLT